MQRYFGKKKDNNIIYLNPDDYNHIKNVMRFKENDNIEVVINDKVYLTKLDKELKSSTIIDELESNVPNYKINLFIPILQEEKIDLILQKCTELDVSSFTFVNMERCKFNISKEKESKKIDRWNKIIKESSEQSLKTYKPIINGIIDFKDINNNANKNIICSLDRENAININNAFENKDNNDIINIVFGPEGGLTNKEEESLVNIGYKKVNFGKSVLRTETCPIFISSVIKYIYG